MARTSKPSNILSVIALVVPAHAKGGTRTVRSRYRNSSPFFQWNGSYPARVVSRKHPAVGPDVCDNARRYIALVEGVRPSTGYRLQRVGQVRLT